MRRSLIAAALLAVMATTRPCAAQAPPKDSAELKVLSHWVGDVETTMEEPAEAKGTATASWICDGRFVREDWKVPATGNGQEMSGSTVMTYDEGARRYRSWTFLSDGGFYESEGTWNAAGRTMRWQSKPLPDGSIITTEARFDADGTQHWTIEGKSRAGEVLFSARGRNTAPRKSPK